MKKTISTTVFACAALMLLISSACTPPPTEPTAKEKQLCLNESSLKSKGVSVPNENKDKAEKEARKNLHVNAASATADVCNDPHKCNDSSNPNSACISSKLNIDEGEASFDSTKGEGGKVLYTATIKATVKYNCQCQ